MVVAACHLEFHLPFCHSLKQKRMFANRLKGRLTARFNVAVAEVAHQELWQRLGVAVVTVASDRRVVEGMFEKVIAEAERQEGELLSCEVEFL